MQARRLVQVGERETSETQRIMRRENGHKQEEIPRYMVAPGRVKRSFNFPRIT
jgi:hypothetical protein